MKIQTFIEAHFMIDALLDAFGDDYDSLPDFIAACQNSRDIEIEAVISDSELIAELSDYQIKSEYEERELGDDTDARDMLAGIHALANGNEYIARTLFARAGNEAAADMLT